MFTSCWRAGCGDDAKAGECADMTAGHPRRWAFILALAHGLLESEHDDASQSERASRKFSVLDTGVHDTIDTQ